MVLILWYCDILRGHSVIEWDKVLNFPSSIDILEVWRVVIDPVCGMEIDEKTAKAKSEYKSKTYYFCGPMCKLEFDENPEKYVQP